MSNIDIDISRAEEALLMNNPEGALSILSSYKKSLKTTNVDHLSLNQIFANIYLETGDLEKAYPLLLKSCELDPLGQNKGCEKFFTLGQITGGEEGIKMLMQGIENISNQAGNLVTQEHCDKIISGLLAIIEIWMTDLCLEPNAEAQCEELINKAMELSDGKSPETWSMLGSIRISQQRFEDAIEAFTKAWYFFQIKSEYIKDHLNNNGNNIVTHSDYLELLQPLLSLAKLCIEMGLYETSLQITSTIKDIDEDNLENFYLEGFTHYLIAKLESFKQNNSLTNLTAEDMYGFNQRFKELSINLNDDITETIFDSRISLSFVLKFGETCDKDDKIAQELISDARNILEELGGPLNTDELIKIRRGEEVNENEEIELDSDS